MLVGKGCNIAVELRPGLRADNAIGEPVHASKDARSGILDAHFDVGSVECTRRWREMFGNCSGFLRCVQSCSTFANYSKLYQPAQPLLPPGCASLLGIYWICSRTTFWKLNFKIKLVVKVAKYITTDCLDIKCLFGLHCGNMNLETDHDQCC